MCSVVSLIVSVVFQMWIMRDMEKLVGAIRMSILYIGSGVAGNLASCTFVPYSVEVCCLHCHVLITLVMYPCLIMT